MYIPQVDAYPAVYDHAYERGLAISEAAADRLAIMNTQTVTEAAGRHYTVAEALDHLAWLLTGDDEAGAAVRHYGSMTLEDFDNLGRASDNIQAADLAGLETALADYAANPF